MRTSDFITGTIALLLIVFMYMHINLTREVRETEKYCYSSLAKDSTFKVKIYKSLDSLNKKDSVLAKSIVYLDSCNQVKASKVERAERRGRFIGGLLKGLFPGM